MNIVYMNGLYDCGAAVLAMVLGLPTARGAYPLLGYDPNEADSAGVGVSEEELSAVLLTCQISHTRYVSLECMAQAHGVTAASLQRRCKIPSEQALQCKLSSRRGLSIVSVPRLGYAGHVPQHFVLVKNNVILDPALRKRYVGDAYSLPVCSMLCIEKLESYLSSTDSRLNLSSSNKGKAFTEKLLEN